jgi:glycosyltransferase involved in cell wall biosynthesis
MKEEINVISNGQNFYQPNKSSVLLLTFNRPDNVIRVLECIKNANIHALYIACDGPRSGQVDDILKIQAIHKIVAQIDWCANVKTLYRESNLGCGHAVSEAITWFMEDAGEGIILEDDCLPDPTFFPFCAEMLNRYRNSPNVMQIAGYNLLSGQYINGSDYLFSQLGWQWGWATWKRAWDHFDIKMKSWPQFKEYGFHKYFPFSQVRVDIFDRTHSGITDTWDYQWQNAMAICHGISVVPIFSLTENIGFGVGATHGQHQDAGQRFLVPVQALHFPLKHCPFIYPDQQYDRILSKKTHPHLTISSRIKRKVRTLLNGILSTKRPNY